jgi:hypothetical protein
MPLTPDEKQRLLLEQGLDPNKYDLEPIGGEAPAVVAPKIDGGVTPPSLATESSNKPTTSARGAFGATFAEGAATMVPAIAAGAAAGAPFGGPVGAGVGAVVGGLTGIASKYLGRKLMPQSWEDYLETAEQEHPIASTAGGIASSLPFFNPVKSVKEVGSLTKALATYPRVGHMPLAAKQAAQNLAISTGAMGGLYAGEQLVTGEPITAGGLAMSTLPGVISVTPTRLGRKAMRVRSPEDIRSRQEAERVQTEEAQQEADFRSKVEPVEFTDRETADFTRQPKFISEVYPDSTTSVVESSKTGKPVIKQKPSSLVMKQGEIPGGVTTTPAEDSWQVIQQAAKAKAEQNRIDAETPKLPVIETPAPETSIKEDPEVVRRTEEFHLAKQELENQQLESMKLDAERIRAENEQKKQDWLKRQTANLQPKLQAGQVASKPEQRPPYVEALKPEKPQPDLPPTEAEEIQRKFDGDKYSEEAEFDDMSLARQTNSVKLNSDKVEDILQFLQERKAPKELTKYFSDLLDWHRIKERRDIIKNNPQQRQKYIQTALSVRKANPNLVDWSKHPDLVSIKEGHSKELQPYEDLLKDAAIKTTQSGPGTATSLYDLNLQPGETPLSKVPELKRWVNEIQSRVSPSKYSESPESTTDIDPEAYKNKVGEIASTRGVKINYVPEVMKGDKSVAGVSSPETSREVQVSTSKMGLDTPIHEPQHVYVNDLKTSSDPVDNKLHSKLTENWKSPDYVPSERELATIDRMRAEGASDEAIGEELMIQHRLAPAQVDRVIRELKGESEAVLISKQYWKDVLANIRYKLGSNDPKVLIDHLTTRFRHDAPYGSRGVEGKGITGVNTGEKYSEESEVKKIRGPISDKISYPGKRTGELKYNPESGSHEYTTTEPTYDPRYKTKEGKLHPLTPYEDVKKFYRENNRPPSEEELSKMGYKEGSKARTRLDDTVYRDIKSYPTTIENESRVRKAWVDYESKRDNPDASTASEQEALETAHRVSRDVLFQEYQKALWSRKHFQKVEVRDDLPSGIGGRYYSLEDRTAAIPNFEVGAYHETIHRLFSNNTHISNRLIRDERNFNGEEFFKHLENASEKLASFDINYERHRQNYKEAIDNRSLESAREIIDETLAHYSEDDRPGLKKTGEYFSKVLFGNDIQSKFYSKDTPDTYMPGYDSNTKRYYSESPEYKVPFRRQIDTPEFKKWFGDSKVVDPDTGLPLRVYHASKGNVTKFDPKYKTDLSSMGFHFGTAEQANFRTTQYDFNSENTSMGKYFLSIKKPLEVSHMGSFAPDHLAETMMDLGILTESKYSSIRDRYQDEPKVGNELVKILKKNGYDGLKYRNEREGEGYSYVPFEPTQIKSATGNKGTFDPTNPDIRYSDSPEYKVPFRWTALRSKIDSLAAVEHTDAKPVAFATKDFHEKFQQNRGQFINDITHKVNKLLDLSPFEDPMGYVKQNNKHTTKVLDYLYDMKESGSSKLILTDKEKLAAKEIRGYLLEIAKTTESRKGLHQIKINEDYIPEMPDTRVLETIFNKPQSAEAKALIKDFIEYQKSHAPRGTKDLDAFAKDNLKNFKAGYDKSNPDIAGSFGPLDKAAGIGLPRSWRERNLMKLLTRYGDRVSRRLAYYDTLDPINPDIKELTDKVYDPEEGIASTSEFKSVMRDIRGYKSPGNELVDSVAGVIRAGWFGPLTGAKDLVNQIAGSAVAWETPGQSAKAVASALGDWSNNWKRSFNSGFNRRNFGATEMGDQVEVFHKIRDITNDVTGRNILEQTTRALAFGKGRWIAQDNFQRMKAGKLDSQGERFMKEFGRDIDLTKAKLSDADIDKIALRYGNDAQVSYDAQDLPSYVTEGQLAPIFSIMRWNFGKANRVVKNTIIPAMNGNIRPLLMSTLGMVMSGTAVSKLVELATNRKDRVPKVGEIAQAYEEGQNIAPALFYKTAALADAAGFAGVMGVIAKSYMDTQFGNKPMPVDNILVSAGGNLHETVTDMIEAYQQGNLSATLDGISQILEDNVQAYRLILAHGSSEKKSEVEKQNKMRDFKTFKNLYDYPVAEPFASGPNKFINKNIRKFKQTSDLSEATSLLPELMSDAVEDSDGDYEKLQGRLRGLKGNSYQTMPSPEENPLQFRKYRKFLGETQGESEGDERTVDFLTQRMKNKIKSSVVP